MEEKLKEIKSVSEKFKNKYKFYNKIYSKKKIIKSCIGSERFGKF